jgi:DNA-binding SARP family transcriptional activator
MCKYYETEYKNRMNPFYATMNKRRRAHENALNETREDLEICEEEKEMLEHAVKVAKGMIVLAQRSKGKCRKTEKMLEEYCGADCMEDGEYQNAIVRTASMEMSRRRKVRRRFHESQRFVASFLQPSASSSQQPS